MAVAAPEGFLDPPAAGRGMHRWLGALGADRRLGAVVTVALGAGLALANSLPMPRAP